jgi:hypothetical protein
MLLVSTCGHGMLNAIWCRRETDETISEPQFINLSYVQAQHDYLAGNYPVVREDAAQVGHPSPGPWQPAAAYVHCIAQADRSSVQDLADQVHWH